MEGITEGKHRLGLHLSIDHGSDSVQAMIAIVSTIIGHRQSLVVQGTM